MSIEKRLEALESAHRALHARHEALMIGCRVLLPFINIPQDAKKLLLLAANEALTEHMDLNGLDDEFQRIARKAIDELAATLMSKVDHNN